MARTVLIVDDEPSLVKGLTLSFTREGFRVISAATGAEGLRLARERRPDVLVLDVMLPGVDGLAVCRELRADPGTAALPIIMLTARGEEVDRVVGLELGADDYLVKPFSTRELLARVRALLRRSERAAQAPALPQAGQTALTIDQAGRAVSIQGRPVSLTATEFELLVFLARNPGHVFTREELLREVWGYDYFGDARTVDVHVRRLREKIEPDPSHPIFVLTSRGAGYCFTRQSQQAGRVGSGGRAGNQATGLGEPGTGRGPGGGGPEGNWPC